MLLEEERESERDTLEHVHIAIYIPQTCHDEPYCCYYIKVFPLLNRAVSVGKDKTTALIHTSYVSIVQLTSFLDTLLVSIVVIKL